MSPHSNPSSLEAQNGSAYSSSYPASVAQSRAAPQRQLCDPSAFDYNRRNRTVPTSESTTYYQDYASAQSAEHHTDTRTWDEQFPGSPNSSQQYTSAQTSSQEYSSFGRYYVPEPPRYNNNNNNSSQEHTSSEQHYFPIYENPETPQYDPEIQIEEDHHNSTDSGDNPVYGRRHQQILPRNHGHQSTQASQTNGAHPPTTERWNGEQLPEERIRLGLSRYPSEEE